MRAPRSILSILSILSIAIVAAAPRPAAADDPPTLAAVAAETTEKLGAIAVTTTELAPGGAAVLIAAVTEAPAFGDPAATLTVRVRFAQTGDYDQAEVLGMTAARAVGAGLERQLRKQHDTAKAYGSGGATEGQVTVALASTAELGPALRATLKVIGTPAISGRDIDTGLFGAPAFGLGGHVLSLRALVRRLYPDVPTVFTDAGIELAAIAARAGAKGLGKFARRWRTAHVEIAVTGPLTADDLAALAKVARAGLKGWKPTAAPAAPTWKPAPRAAGAARIDGDDKLISGFAIGQAVTLADDRAARRVDLVVRVAKARLSARLARERGDDRHMIAVALDRRGAVLFRLAAAFPDAEPAVVETWTAAMIDELRALTRSGPTRAQLDAAATEVIRDLLPTSLRSHDLLDDVDAGRDFAGRATVVAELAAVTPADAKAAWKAAVDPDQLVSVIAGGLDRD